MPKTSKRNRERGRELEGPGTGTDFWTFDSQSDTDNLLVLLDISLGRELQFRNFVPPPIPLPVSRERSKERVRSIS